MGRVRTGVRHEANELAAAEESNGDLDESSKEYARREERRTVRGDERGDDHRTSAGCARDDAAAASEGRSEEAHDRCGLQTNNW